MPSWRNWISRLTSNQKIVGSSPTGGNKIIFIVIECVICICYLTYLTFFTICYYIFIKENPRMKRVEIVSIMFLNN